MMWTRMSKIDDATQVGIRVRTEFTPFFTGIGTYRVFQGSI